MGGNISETRGFPDDCPIGEARERTQDDHRYFNELLLKAQTNKQFALELKKRELLGVSDTEDRFTFCKGENGIWVLRCCMFRELNFDLYKFEGLPNLEGLEEISAIRPLVID